MRRTLLGWFIMLHATAHAGVAMWAMGGDPWLVATLWCLAVTAYFAAALGLLRFPWLRNQWETWLMIGVAMSIILTAVAPGLYSLIGAFISVGLAVIALVPSYRRIDADITAINTLGERAVRHPNWERAGWILGLNIALYMAVVAATRPIYITWGSTRIERVAALPGDSALPAGARYRVDHAVTVRAPAESVWAWVVQIGQDRAGFYGHDWLERAFGAQIHNAREIRDEWQRRSVGDTVFATQPGYLGGIFGDHPGWRVSAVLPGRAMVLENWGAFVVVPDGESHSRLIVRTRGEGAPGVLPFVLAPLNVFGFEPVHFIMQRAMLHGIRDRAEGRAQRSP